MDKRKAEGTKYLKIIDWLEALVVVSALSFLLLCGILYEVMLTKEERKLEAEAKEKIEGLVSSR